MTKDFPQGTVFSLKCLVVIATLIYLVLYFTDICPKSDAIFAASDGNKLRI